MAVSSQPHHPRVALVLQGGGALGAYQAGVYQALHEYDMIPDWVVGTSIGAINAALIAGNPPENRLERLRQFWERISHDDPVDLERLPDPLRQWSIWMSTNKVLWQGVAGFFTPRPCNPFALGLPVTPESTSFYDTSELERTLLELVDFELLNRAGSMRTTVSAVEVTTGELVSFDNRQRALGAEHIMASGALPPGFAPVRVDGKLYWDGGLYSNTPLDIVLDDTPRVSTLCFMVDLWRRKGDEPTTLGEVQNREKDVRYASRSQRHIEAYRKTHNLRRAIHHLYHQLPDELKGLPEIQALAEHGCHTTMHIVRLVYPGQDWHMASKDINFSRGSIQWRWEQGYQDTCRALQDASWTRPVPAHIGVITHEPGREPKF